MRSRFRPNHATVVAYLALFIALGGTTYAATGGNFILGQSNSASSKTSLSAPISNKALQLTNTSTGTGATALGLNVASGHPPFTVNSAAKVANLNAEKLDGKDSTELTTSAVNATANACLDDNGDGDDCITLPVNLAHAGKVFLVASGDALHIADDDADNPSDGIDHVEGNCRFRVDGADVGQPQTYYARGFGTPTGLLEGALSLNTVTGALTAGSHNFVLRCTEVDGDVDWGKLSMTAVVL
jgi:hypothetical protein